MFSLFYEQKTGTLNGSIGRQLNKLIFIGNSLQNVPGVLNCGSETDHTPDFGWYVISVAGG
jgi:hypothetical protein